MVGHLRVKRQVGTVLRQIDQDGVALLHFATQDALAESVLDIVLDGTLQRTRTKLDVVALLGHKLLGSVRELERVAQLADPLVQALEFDIDNLLDGVEVQLVEGDDLVQTVEELRRELLAQTLLYDGPSILLVLLVAREALDRKSVV